MWAEYAANGQPAFNVCYSCADVVGRIRPSMTLEAALASYQEGREFKADFNKAADIANEKEDAPTFRPSSSVTHHAKYGFCVYEEYALVSETEFLSLAGVTPKQAGKKPLQLALSGPGSKNNFYALSLKGLSWEVAAGLKKAGCHLLPLPLDPMSVRSNQDYQGSVHIA